MNKAEAWREWWAKIHKTVPAGSYTPREAPMWEAWEAAWEEANKQSQVEINHLKEQLLRANTNDGAYKAAFLAGQMSSKPISRAEMKDWANVTWQKCQEQEPVTRPWVGLTYEEIKFLRNWWPSYKNAPALIQLVKDVEAKLREKNEIRNP